MSQVTSSLGGVPGILTRDELATSASYLAGLQLPSGQIPWFVGGHSDPWNHVEAAMALTVAGYEEEARAAYRWLAATQLGDGSWFNVRASNTEPLLRLNVEAPDAERMAAVRDEALAVIRG